MIPITTRKINKNPITSLEKMVIFVRSRSKKSMHVSQALWRTHLFLIALPFGSPRESWKLQLKANGYHLRSCCHGFSQPNSKFQEDALSMPARVNILLVNEPGWTCPLSNSIVTVFTQRDTMALSNQPVMWPSIGNTGNQSATIHKIVLFFLPHG